MKVFYLTVVTTILTFVLLVVGGIVNPSGASLACPDWPTCYGSFFPQMVGGVGIEHSHRLIASLVGFLVCILTISIWRGRPEDKQLHWFGLVALLIVILQGLLGGITVLFKLPMAVSAAHLGLSMIFFCYMIFLCFRVLQGRSHIEEIPAFAGMRANGQKWGLVAGGFVYFQILLGAIVRHTGAGRVCGNDFLLCMGLFWPDGWALQLHMFHRLFAFVTLAVIIVAHIKVLRVAKQHGQKVVSRLAKLLPTLTLLQIVVGMGMVKRWIAVPEATTHLALAALLLGTVVLIYFFLEVRASGPLKVKVGAPA